ncbi:MAG: class I SAM-dependent methyltransferase [Deltaproteobacteria bacterium]|nr:class I SAM-dependent methyltransferase [Deltaproteobacteria bacterium]
MKNKKRPGEKKIQRINKIQREFFGKITHVFDPPLPEGVPERLDQIVACAEIKKGDCILDVGSGTGILLPLIHKYKPEKIFACDLSKEMLESLKKQHPYAIIIRSDARDLTLPDGSIDLVFVNACYSNLVDKKGFFINISRMMKTGGRMVISHPMGRGFIDLLREKSPFPLDDFPHEPEAKIMLAPHGLNVNKYIDQEDLYILVAIKQNI